FAGRHSSRTIRTKAFLKEPVPPVIKMVAPLRSNINLFPSCRPLVRSGSLADAGGLLNPPQTRIRCLQRNQPAPRSSITQPPRKQVPSKAPSPLSLRAHARHVDQAMLEQEDNSGAT